jgi:hypothetical protein
MFRDKFSWLCTLQAETGDVIETTLESYWSPDKVSSEFIANTAAAEAFVTHDKKLRFVPIAAQLVA